MVGDAKVVGAVAHIGAHPRCVWVLFCCSFGVSSSSQWAPVEACTGLYKFGSILKCRSVHEVMQNSSGGGVGVGAAVSVFCAV